jgi:hypothetical protein
MGRERIGERDREGRGEGRRGTGKKRDKGER